MKKTQASTKSRQRAVLDLMNKGITSPTKIVKMLKEEYGIETSRNTVHRDISSGITPMTEKIIEEHRDTMLDNLDELLRISYNKGVRGDNQSSITYGKLLKTRAEVLQKIVEIQQEMRRAERPLHFLSIGEFPEAKKKEIEKKTKESKTDE